MHWGGGERWWCRKILRHAQPGTLRCEKDACCAQYNLANDMLVQCGQPRARTQPNCCYTSARVLQLTSRLFTTCRSRAKHGAGMSAPVTIWYFHDPRGKQRKALRCVK